MPYLQVLSEFREGVRQIAREKKGDVNSVFFFTNRNLHKCAIVLRNVIFICTVVLCFLPHTCSSACSIWVWAHRRMYSSKLLQPKTREVSACICLVFYFAYESGPALPLTRLRQLIVQVMKGQQIIYYYRILLPGWSRRLLDFLP